MSDQALQKLILRPASPAEAGQLSDLALRSKGYWGYSQAFLEACRSELSYSCGMIEDATFDFVVAEINRQIVGFYALSRVAGNDFELEALFVEPEHIGKGIGRTLLEHAKCAAANQGGTTIVVQGDPHAEAFYRAAGGVPIGFGPSGSIPGRNLPMFSIDLSAE